jgi:hypothetical protein
LRAGGADQALEAAGALGSDGSDRASRSDGADRSDGAGRSGGTWDAALAVADIVELAIDLVFDAARRAVHVTRREGAHRHELGPGAAT